MAPRPVAVIGLGCIGGSLARALIAQEVEVRGWSASPSDREQAAAARVHVSTADDGASAACAGAGIVVLAVPIRTVAEVADSVRPALARNAKLLHVCGLQSRDALGVDDDTHALLLGTHPLAGSHDTGFGASRPELFVDAVISAEERADPRHRACIEWLWHTVGARRVDYRSAEAHDRLMAWVSQLPQLTATALAATLAAGGIEARTIGSGARDTTRLAASDLGSWPTLLAGAPRELDAALELLGNTISDLRSALGSGDGEALAAIWNSGRAWRREGARTAGAPSLQRERDANRAEQGA
ncbi:MAG TPA: prephenate dehydrogenase/arogenate dehydrogenase family protein [Gemmatimonadaceae bacterium]|nr:prephenate dehydrogenase/arogenate dehydrogenase family protein [Gemmatimonadaceae bacterium]